MCFPEIPEKFVLFFPTGMFYYYASIKISSLRKYLIHPQAMIANMETLYNYIINSKLCYETSIYFFDLSVQIRGLEMFTKLSQSQRSENSY